MVKLTNKYLIAMSQSTPFNCVVCGIDSIGFPGQKYCSKVCRTRSHNKTQQNKYYTPVSYNKVCVECGTTYVSHHKKTSFCGPKCRNSNRYKSIKVPAEQRECLSCNKVFQPVNRNARFCSLLCRQVACGDANYQQTKRCVVCAIEFNTTLSFQKSCGSKACRLALKANVDSYWGSKRRQRIKRFGERIDSIAIFNKYNWHCAHCGVHTPKELKGSRTNPLAPELDHITPLSKGGMHTYDNVQLLCKACNLKKKNKTKENNVRNK